MAQLYEIQTVWEGVAGAPYYSTVRGLVAGPTTPQGMADAWEVFLNGLKAVTNDQIVAIINPEVRVIESTTGQTQGVLTIDEATIAMTAGGDPLPSLCQLLVRWQTNVFVGGRRLRGRTFIPGQMEANNDASGVPSAGLRSGVEANANAFLAATGGDAVIYSPTNSTYQPIFSASVGLQWSFLRSRRD